MAEAPTIKHTDAGSEWATSTPRVPLFSVERDGETVEFTMPAKPNPGVALRYLKKARDEGELANVWVIETAIGEAGIRVQPLDISDLFAVEVDFAEDLERANLYV